MNSIAQRLGQVSSNLETATKAGEFVTIARLLCAARADQFQAAELAAAQHMPPRVIQVLKSGVFAGGLDSGNWGAQLGEFPGLVAAFLDSLRNYGAFDAMLPSMKRVPLRTRIGIVSVGATGAIVPGGHVTPISNLTFAENGELPERKALAIIAISKELARLAGAAGNDLFARELRTAIAFVTDEQFLALITAGVSPITSNGGTAVAILQDLAAAFAAVETGVGSSLFIIVEPATAKAWATKTTADGALAFPGMGPHGGEIANTPVIVSSGLTPASIVVADAYQIAAAAGVVELGSSEQADLQFNTAPDSPTSAATIMRSLWQHNEIALKAMRYFGALRLGADAVAVIEGVTYSGNSPA